MEKREPALVPEWLRSTGNCSSGDESKNHNLSSSACPDSSLAHNSKNKNNMTKYNVDSVRSPFPDRYSATNARRGFSNWSNRNTYVNFNVQRNSHRDKYRSREKDRVSYMDPCDHDTLPFGSFLNGKDQEQLRRSHSMTTRKQGDHLTQRFRMGLRNGRSINNAYNRNGILPEPSLAKSTNRNDFLLLRPKERNGSPDVERISSPGLSSAVQSLVVGNPELTDGEGWTLALAEVPKVIEKSASVSHANIGTSLTIMGQTCRNMVEAVVQAPRIVTPPQGSSKIQRLEDRTLKQSRQLIPVVPSAPKGSVLTKEMVRSGEHGLCSVRNTHQQSSILLGNLPSNRGSQIKPDATKKLVVLKPATENGVSAAKESGTPSLITNSLAAARQMTAASSIQVTADVPSKNNPRELGGTFTNMPTEKKISIAQTRSRSAFYSALKKKKFINILTDPSKTSSSIFSSTEVKKNISKGLLLSDSSSVQSTERDDIFMEWVKKVFEVAEKNSGFELVDHPDEKEAEFLKSLGWEENNSEDKPLTEKEIKAFIEKCKKLKPSLMQKHII